MMSNPLIDFVNGDKQVASLPGIFFQLKEAIDDPECTYEDIGNLILHDPGLSARLLKVVNSAFYSFSQPIETISHAIMIVGIDQLQELVLSTIVINRFKGIPEDLMNMHSFWEHSIACGLAARAIAQIRGEPNTERFFVSGLLHDIGRLVLCLTLPEKAKESMEQSQSRDLPLHMMEQEILGFSHEDVGRALLRSWHLPKTHQEAVGFHHNPSAAPTFALEASTVHIGDMIANTLELGNSGEMIGITLDPNAKRLAKIGEDLFITTIMKQVAQQFQTTSEAFLQPS